MQLGAWRAEPRWNHDYRSDPSIYDPELVPIFTIGHQFAFTNSALFMFIIVILVSALLIAGTAPRAIVPGRLQSIAEMSYEFVANTVRTRPATRA